MTLNQLDSLQEQAEAVYGKVDDIQRDLESVKDKKLLLKEQFLKAQEKYIKSQTMKLFLEELMKVDPSKSTEQFDTLQSSADVKKLSEAYQEIINKMASSRKEVNDGLDKIQITRDEINRRMAETNHILADNLHKSNEVKHLVKVEKIFERPTLQQVEQEVEQQNTERMALEEQLNDMTGELYESSAKKEELESEIQVLKQNLLTKQEALNDQRMQNEKLKQKSESLRVKYESCLQFLERHLGYQLAIDSEQNVMTVQFESGTQRATTAIIEFAQDLSVDKVKWNSNFPLDDIIANVKQDSLHMLIIQLQSRLRTFERRLHEVENLKKQYRVDYNVAKHPDTMIVQKKDVILALKLDRWYPMDLSVVTDGVRNSGFELINVQPTSIADKVQDVQNSNNFSTVTEMVNAIMKAL
ncbi:hypothetical protein MP228_007180 [Amoeboaphelidium protococcarum]|nr:hypothetical protein MP228_007180 [Amoeboaphelidium protococcarum]